MTDGDLCPVEFVEFRHDKPAVPATFFKLVVVPFLFVVEAETCAGRTSVEKVNVFTLVCAESLQPVKSLLKSCNHLNMFTVAASGVLT